MRIRVFFLILTSLFLGACSPPEEDTVDDTTITEEVEEVPVFFPIIVDPNDPTIITNTSTRFSATGGKPPYTYSITSGPGSISETLGIFNSGTITGNVFMEVKDSVNQIKVVRIKIVNPLSLNPATAQMYTNSNIQLESSGGVSPYTYWVSSGGGIVTSIGQYISGAVAGDVVVSVVDSMGTVSNSQVSIRSPVQLVGPTTSINRGDNFQFTANGGFPPYLFRILNGGGTISSTTGVYQAPAIAGSVTIEVIDSIGGSSQVTAQINNLALSLNQTNVSLQVGQNFSFKALGGLAPYTFSFVGSGNQGSILGSGVYFAPASTTTVDTIQVIDSENNTVNAQITVNPQILISPTERTTVVNRSEIFFVTGGIPPYTFLIQSGNGIINPSSGVFLAPAIPGETIVRVRDSQNNFSDSIVTTNPDVEITPTNPQIARNNTINFLGTGGVPPFDYSVISGPGIISNSGLYDPQGITGVATIQVRDSKNTTKTTTVTVNDLLRFVESPIVVKAGATKNILISGGVPPYTLHFRDGNSQLSNFSVYGSTFENNFSPLGSSPIETQNGLNELIITKINHGLSVGQAIRFYSLTNCNVFNENDLNTVFNVGFVLDADRFTVNANKNANSSTVCGGSLAYFRKLSGTLFYRAGLVSNIVTEMLVVRDSLQNEYQELITIDGGLVGFFDLALADQGLSPFDSLTNCNQVIKNLMAGLDATISGCDNQSGYFYGTGTNEFPYSINLNPLSLNLELETNKNLGEENSIELWAKWDGSRITTNFSHFDANLIGFSNYNLSFMNIKTGVTTFNRGLCFNTKVSAPYDCYGFLNPDPFISNRWTHYVIIFNNGDYSKNKIYINGIEQAMQFISPEIPLSVSIQDDFFKIGSALLQAPSMAPDINNHQFNGEIGLIRFYNRKITPDEINFNYNQSKDRFQFFNPNP